MAKINLNLKTPNFVRPVLLLHPNIPKPMHGLNPRTVMGKEWWDKHRKAAQAENNYHCWACGVHRSQAKYHTWLEGHESYEIDYQRGVMRLEEIVSLCHSCHNFIHDGLLLKKAMSGQITRERYNGIIDHGNEVIRDLPGFLMNTFEGYFAPWKEWHLLIDGQKHYSKFRNLREWENHYGKS